MPMVDNRADWSAAAEAALVNFLLKAVQDGLMSDNNFKASTYTAASKELSLLGYTFNSKQIKSRWTRFKEEFKIVKELRFSVSGFGWDDTRKMVTAEDEVWERYIKGHAKAKPFRKKVFPLYDQIAAIIGDTAAVGDLAFSSENSRSATEPSTQSTAFDESFSNISNDENSDKEVSEKENKEPNIQINHGSKKRRACSPTLSLLPASAPKRARHSGAHALHSLADSVNLMVKSGFMGGHSNQPLHSALSTPKKDRAFKIICHEEGLSPYSLAMARKVFRGDNDLAEEYLSFDIDVPGLKEARSLWLADEISHLRRHNSDL